MPKKSYAICKCKEVMTTRNWAKGLKGCKCFLITYRKNKPNKKEQIDIKYDIELREKK